MSLQDLTKEHIYAFMSDKASLMDLYHKHDLYKSHLDFFMEKCFHIDLDNSIFKINGDDKTIEAIYKTMDLLNIFPSPNNFRIFDYANFALVYGFVNISYHERNAKLTIGDPKSTIEFFKPLDIFGEGVSFYDKLFKPECLESYKRLKVAIIEKIQKDVFDSGNFEALKDATKELQNSSIIPSWYYTACNSLQLKELNFEELYKNNIDDRKYIQYILEKEESFNSLISKFRNWIKDFILYATKITNPLISMDELNKVQFIFNEKDVSLNSFKKYIELQNNTIIKIVSDYEKHDHDKSEQHIHSENDASTEDFHQSTIDIVKNKKEEILKNLSSMTDDKGVPYFDFEYLKNKLLNLEKADDLQFFNSNGPE